MKAKIIGVVAIVAVGSAVGMSVYSDTKLKKKYTDIQTVINDNRLVAKDVQFEMGALNGKASGVIEFIPDLCSPDFKFELRFEDTIKRGILGYEVNSKLYPITGDTVAPINLDMVSKIDWSGNVDSHIVLKGKQFTTSKGMFSFSDVVADLKLVKAESGYGLKNYQINWDNFVVEADNNNIKLDKLKINGHSDKPNALFANTDAKVELGQLSIGDIDKNEYMIFKDIQFSSNQMVKSNKLNTDLSYQIGNMDINIKDVKKNLENIQFNLAINDLDQSVFPPLEEFLKLPSQQCISDGKLQEKVAEILQPAVINLAKTGLTIESKDSQVKSGNYGINLNASAAIAPINLPEGTTQLDTGIFINMLTNLKYEFSLNVDKGFLKEVLSPEDYADLDLQLEYSKQQLPAGFHLKYDADKIEFYGSQN